MIEFKNRAGDNIFLDLRKLNKSDLNMILELQDEILSDINPDIFQKSFESEILDSIENDYCFGLFDKNSLCAFCMCVNNRESERNYCHLTDEKDCFDKFFSFDTIQVKKQYRGFKIQRFFLSETEKAAKSLGAEFILATVSPSNPYSLNMFKEANFKIYKNKEIKAYNSTRYLMIKALL